MSILFDQFFGVNILTWLLWMQVLDKDLAIFGFFIALGRRTQSYLSANNFEAVPKPIEGLIR